MTMLYQTMSGLLAITRRKEDNGLTADKWIKHVLWLLCSCNHHNKALMTIQCGEFVPSSCRFNVNSPDMLWDTAVAFYYCCALTQWNASAIATTSIHTYTHREITRKLHWLSQLLLNRHWVIYYGSGECLCVHFLLGQLYPLAEPALDGPLSLNCSGTSSRRLTNSRSTPSSLAQIIPIGDRRHLPSLWFPPAALCSDTSCGDTSEVCVVTRRSRSHHHVVPDYTSNLLVVMEQTLPKRYLKQMEHIGEARHRGPSIKLGIGVRGCNKLKPEHFSGAINKCRSTTDLLATDGPAPPLICTQLQEHCACFCPERVDWVWLIQFGLIQFLG